jgi:hypothetical protein
MKTNGRQTKRIPKVVSVFAFNFIRQVIVTAEDIGQPIKQVSMTGTLSTILMYRYDHRLRLHDIGHKATLRGAQGLRVGKLPF